MNDVTVQGGTDVMSLAELGAGMETKIGANEGFDLKINRADGDFSGLSIRILGIDSNAYQSLKEQLDRKRVKLLSKMGRSGVDQLYDHSKNDEMELTLLCLLGWSHINGKAMPFDIGTDKASAKNFLLAYPVVHDQVRLGIADRMNFTKASASL